MDEKSAHFPRLLEPPLVLGTKEYDYRPPHLVSNFRQFHVVTISLWIISFQFAGP